MELRSQDGKRIMADTAEHTFFDGFFYVVSVIAFILIAVDWWIGPARRGAMRDKMIDWWDYLDDRSFTGLVADDAGRVRRGLQFVFGEKWFAWRAILLTFLLSLLITHLCFWLGHSVVAWNLWGDFYETNSSHYPDNYPPWYIYALLRGFESAFEPSTYYPTIGRFLALNAVADLASLYLTIYLLRRMEESTSALRLTGIILVDVAIVFVLTSVVFDIGIRSTWNVHPNYAADTHYLMKESFLLLSPTLIYEYAMGAGPAVGGLLAQMALLSLFLSSAAPTIVHLIIASVFLLSKSLAPVCKPVVMTLLERFSESRKGVLTQIALGGGTIAKVAQEGLKFL